MGKRALGGTCLIAMLLATSCSKLADAVVTNPCDTAVLVWFGEDGGMAKPLSTTEFEKVTAYEPGLDMKLVELENAREVEMTLSVPNEDPWQVDIPDSFCP